MKNEEMDVFARAFLFLYSAALKQEGIEADLTVTRIPNTRTGGETNS